MRNTIIYIIIGLSSLLLTAGCSSPLDDNFHIRWENMDEVHGNRKDDYTDRDYSNISRKVMLLYSAGFNSLVHYLTDDIEDLKQGWIPGAHFSDDVLLVYTHKPKTRGSYKDLTNPYLIRLSRTSDGSLVSDTLVTYPKGTISSSAAQLNKVLSHIKENFPSDSYGMIFSSHATGYLPAGYYHNPDNYTFGNKGMSYVHGRNRPVPVPYVEPEHDPSLPEVKSIGQDVNNISGEEISYEIGLKDFADAIPMKMKYIIFDACLMGGIEVAHQLREKTDLIGFSQAEVLAEGLDYKTMTKHLLKKEEPDPKAVCEDYFAQYDIQSGLFRSATISLIDCRHTEELAAVCHDIFAAHRKGLEDIVPHNVQRFYRYDKHWFYDLESIVTEAGATERELEALHSALDKCVLYKAHTPQFIEDFDINIFSGFSMYLPCHGSKELDKYYRTLSWNIATELVE